MCMSTEHKPMQLNQKTVMTVLVALAVALGIFYAGTRYEKSKLRSLSHSQSNQSGNATKKVKSLKKTNTVAPANGQGATVAPTAPATSTDTTGTPQDTTTDTTTGSDSGN